MPEIAGAIAYGQISRVRVNVVIFSTRFAIVARNNPEAMETKATEPLKIKVVINDFR